MSYSLNSLKGVIYGILREITITVVNGDTRSLDCSSHGASEKDSSLHRVLGGVPC